MVHFGNNGNRRRGFSLVELMVVIAIIGVLFGLAAGAAFQVVGVQRTSNTETAMTTIGRTLQAHWDYVSKEAAKEEPSPAALDLAGGDRSRARVIWVKLRQAEAFPQSYDEVKIAISGLIGTIYGPHALDPTGSKGALIPQSQRKYMKKYWDAIQKTAQGPIYPVTNPLAESTACLYLSLINSRGGSKLDEANLAGNVVDADGDGIKEIIDGFGKPIRFQRFLTNPATARDKAPYSYTTPLTPRIPTSLYSAMPAGLAKAQDELASKSTRGDPTDPEGTLRQTDATQGGAFWCRTPKGLAFAAVCDVWFPTSADANLFPSVMAINNDPDALSQPYFLPHLSSSGRDEIFFTDDDIYSFRLLRVGSGGS